MKVDMNLDVMIYQETEENFIEVNSIYVGEVEREDTNDDRTIECLMIAPYDL